MGSIQNYKFDLDETLENEIKFGKYQVFVFMLIAFPIFLSGIYDSMYIFTAGDLNYRCEIPPCEQDSAEFHPSWLNISTPFNADSPEKCLKFQYVSNESYSCEAESFDRSVMVGCESFIFEGDELTIQNQFGITCGREYQLSLIGTIGNIGTLICFFFVGLLSDRLGRKIFITFGVSVNLICGLLRYFAVNYYQYATIEFFDALLGSTTYSAAYIIGLELVTPKLRTISGVVLNCFYAVGGIYLGSIAMLLRNYKSLLLTIYIPYVIIIVHFFWLPESIRWLFSKGKNEEAKKILNTACKLNGTTMSENTLNALNEKIEFEKADGCEPKDEEKTKRISCKIILQIMIIAYLWFTSVFVYYGLNRNSVYLEYWDKYINFIFVSAIELPGYFITQFLMDKLCRKKTLFIGLMGSGFFIILSEFIPGVLYTTILFVCGKLLITVAFSCLYIFTIEVFPTNVRHGFFAACFIVGRIGSVLTPMTPLLAEITPSLPMILFASFSFTSAIFLCYLPETRNRKLPESMGEAFN